jgi:hypothetical protein
MKQYPRGGVFLGKAENGFVEDLPPTSTPPRTKRMAHWSTPLKVFQRTRFCSSYPTTTPSFTDGVVVAHWS